MSNQEGALYDEDSSEEQYYDDAISRAEAVWDDVELLQQHERQQRRLSSKLPLPLLPRSSHYLHKANPEDIKLFRTLFGLLSRALMSASAVYGVARIREFARRFPDSFKGSAESKRRLMEFPISRRDIIELFQINFDELQRNMPADLYLGAVERFAGEEQAKLNASRGGGEEDQSMLQVIHDEGEGLVYMIVVDEKRHEFRLSFRGTVSLKDLRADLSTSYVYGWLCRRRWCRLSLAPALTLSTSCFEYPE